MPTEKVSLDKKACTKTLFRHRRETFCVSVVVSRVEFSPAVELMDEQTGNK